MLVSIAAQLAMPLSAVLEQNMIDFIVCGDMTGFLHMLWYTVLAVLGAALAYFLTSLTSSKFRAHLEEDLRNDLYDSIMDQGLAEFHRRDTGEYISMINNDVGTLGNNFSGLVFSMVGMGVATVTSLVVMTRYSPLLALVAVLCSAISFLVPMALTKRLQKRMVEGTECSAALSLQLKEGLNGHEVVSALGVFPKVRMRFGKANRFRTEAHYKIDLLVSLLQNSASVVEKIIKVITFMIAGRMAIQEQITIGTVLLFVSLYDYFGGGIMVFSQVVPLLKGCQPVIEKLMGIIHERDGNVTGENTPAFEKKIQVRNLCFAYKDDIPVLTDLNTVIRKREKLALVGASGCGKSTFIKLLSGNYNSYQGEIFYDGVELRNLNLRELRKIVTVIHQNTYIFNDTIRYNICLGEEFSEEELQKALFLSGVSKFLPDVAGGLDGDCGENGGSLSGGQKQRIALARALIRGIDFLILDEGVSAIDVETANEIEQDLLNMKDLTLLTITHRIKDGLIDQYDRVLAMAEGKVSEQRSVCNEHS